MEEKSVENQSQYIKVLNKEKVLEFQLNQITGFDESEIIFQNISQKNIVSKIYINNYKHFKCSPNIISLSKNSTVKIKVIKDDKNYTLTNSDIFLIISHPMDNQQEKDEKKLNEIFKNNGYKDQGQKIFLVGYKKSEEKKENKEDELVKKIKELEKEVFEKAKVDNVEIKKEIKNDVKTEIKNEIKNDIKTEIRNEIPKTEKQSTSIITYLIILGLLVLVFNFFLAKFIKKEK